jgi:hypothetical protein
MNLTQLTDKTFLFLADPQRKLWSDIEIRSLLEDAIKQYSKDSCAFIGRFDLMPDENGNYIYPDDFAGFMIGWNKNGKEICPTTSSELFERQYGSNIKKGDPIYLYDNIVSRGEYKLNPVPEKNQNTITADISPFWGELPINGFGAFVDDGWGVATALTEYDFVGDVYYYRYAECEEIQDYMAVIFYAVYLAYSNDSDFANAKQADMYLQRYRMRVAAFNRIKVSSNGKEVHNKYF